MDHVQRGQAQMDHVQRGQAQMDHVQRGHAQLPFPRCHSKLPFPNCHSQTDIPIPLPFPSLCHSHIAATPKPLPFPSRCHPHVAAIPALPFPNCLPQLPCPNGLCSNCLIHTACLKLPGDTPSCLALCPYPSFKCQNQSCLSKLPAPTALPKRPVPKLPVSNCLVTHPVAWPCALTQTPNAQTKAAFPNCLSQLPCPDDLFPNCLSGTPW